MRKELTLRERKQKAQEEMDSIRREEELQAGKEIRDGNYERFKNRGTDWIIGKAHAQFDFSGEVIDAAEMPTSVTINGNYGETYHARAQVTSATNVYFHNCIPGNYKAWFERKMREITKELMEKVLSSPQCVLEIMGLQSTRHYSSTKFFNEDDIGKIEKEIENEQDEVLNKFTIEELEATSGLSHGSSILSRHLAQRKAKKK